MTPQIKQEDLDEIKEMKKNKKSPFSPDYNDNPYMNDDDVAMKLMMMEI